MGTPSRDLAAPRTARYSARRAATRIVALSLALLATGSAVAAADSPLTSLLPTPSQLCALVHLGERCNLGHGLPPTDCSPCVSHKGWPLLTGVRWQVIEDSLLGHQLIAGPHNDELLGRHGSDTIVGEGGDDIIWGDSQHNGNTIRQHDTLDGGAGDDWIYASHGRNSITGGSGNDIIFAYYGRGTVNCGPGRDTVTVLRKRRIPPYRLKGCEIVRHPGNY